MLRDGTCDAVIQPHPPASIMSGEVAVRRLFEDADAEEQRYYKKYGWWPIMHILVMWQELADKNPWLPQALMEMWGQARSDQPQLLRRSQLVAARLGPALFRA